MANKQNTQLAKANSALVELSKNVSTQDRQEAMKQYSEFTIVQYLNGRGKNVDTAVTLLTFFRKRISDRDKAIA